MTITVRTRMTVAKPYLHTLNNQTFIETVRDTRTGIVSEPGHLPKQCHNIRTPKNEVQLILIVNE